MVILNETKTTFADTRLYTRLGINLKMNETQVQYRDWELYSDKDITEQTYKKFKHSGAESCGCDYCKNFIAQRETVFPDEIKELFRDGG